MVAGRVSQWEWRAICDGESRDQLSGASTVVVQEAQTGWA